MMLSAPCKIPAAPNPATARPTMKTLEFGAAAQMVEPTLHNGQHENINKASPTFKDQDCHAIYNIRLEVLVGGAIDWLKSSYSHQVSCPIPRSIVQ